MNKVNTLKEVLDIILSEMHQTNKDFIKKVKEDDLIHFHSTLGRQIRNKFLLWDGNIKLAEDMGLEKGTHADEVSQKIIEALWKRLNNEDGKEVKDWLKTHLCPDDCEFLNPTGEEQNSIHRLGKPRECHFCTKYDQQLFHGCFHPIIIAVKNCKYTTKGEN